MARAHRNTAKAVRGQIEKAFAHRAYPGDENLVAGVSPQSADDEEEIARVMRGKHWKGLSVQFLRLHESGLYFLSPEAFRFYLPAYLIASIVDPNKADIIAENLFTAFAFPAEDISPARIKWWADRMNGFTEAEKQAIKSWLEYMIDSEPGYLTRQDLSEEGIRFWGLADDAGK